MRTELQELVSTLMHERDEARAEVERLRAIVQDLCKVLDECVWEIDTRYGPPGSNNIDRELIERAYAALAKAKEERDKIKDTNFTPGKWTVCKDAFGKYVVNESGDHVCEICGTAADVRLIREWDKARAEVKRLRAALAGEEDDKHERAEE